MHLAILSGGAAQGVVHALAQRFREATGYTIVGSFGAVGAMKEKLLAGEPADVLILTRTLIAELAAAGHVLAGAHAELGSVRTGVAVPAGAPIPDVSTGEALRVLLREARGIYVPDPQRATAGIHFMKVLDALGLRAPLAARLRPHANGAAAMQAMARATEAPRVGCTQITEVNSTPGVTLAGALPRPFELATVYAAGVCARAASPDPARRLVELLTGDASREVRARAGFEW